MPPPILPSTSPRAFAPSYIPDITKSITYQAPSGYSSDKSTPARQLQPTPQSAQSAQSAQSTHLPTLLTIVGIFAAISLLMKPTVIRGLKPFDGLTMAVPAPLSSPKSLASFPGSLNATTRHARKRSARRSREPTILHHLP